MANSERWQGTKNEKLFLRESLKSTWSLIVQSLADTMHGNWLFDFLSVKQSYNSVHSATPFLLDHPKPEMIL